MPVLANENHERYSRLRAILVPPRAAVKAIGLNPSSGIATKLEQNRAIKARIAELVAIDEEIVREKRDQIETALSAIAYGDGSEFPGKRVALDWPHRLSAINQLRDMHGFKAPAKTELSGDLNVSSVIRAPTVSKDTASWQQEHAPPSPSVR